MREEYPEGIVGDSYDKDVSNVSKILPPSLHTPNNDIRQNSHDQVQTPLREDHNPHLDTHQTNGIKKVILYKKLDVLIFQSPSHGNEYNANFDALTRIERVFTTLIRDQNQGLGFSISGGKGAEPFIEGSDAVFISKVAEDGPAAKDAKLMVGDKIIQVSVNY